MPISRTSLIFIFLAMFGIGLYYFYEAEGPYSVEKYVQNGDLLTLETKVSAEEIMDRHKEELIGTSGRTFQEPLMQFHPYLLMQVKYFDKNHKTKQGSLIWSQMDGEIVLNTDTWDQTRGYCEAIIANTTPLEFRILNALADNKAPLAREKMQKDLNMEANPLNALLDSLKNKQLIVVKGQEIALHLENPRLNVLPQTKMNSSLVVKPYRQGKKLSPRHSKSKIERTAKAAFGNEFTILETEEIYLPVIRISMLNPDGSLLITDWNAITGNKLHLGPVLR